MDYRWHVPAHVPFEVLRRLRDVVDEVGRQAADVDNGHAVSAEADLDRWQAIGRRVRATLLEEGWISPQPEDDDELNEHLDDELDEELKIDADFAPCALCGCTDEHACPEGCWWVAHRLEGLAPNICSACVDTIRSAVDVNGVLMHGDTADLLDRLGVTP